jgi:hypothetical protein
VAQQVTAIIQSEVEQFADALNVGDAAPRQSRQWGVHDRRCDTAPLHPQDAEGHIAVELILDRFNFGQFRHGDTFALERPQMQSGKRV